MLWHSLTLADSQTYVDTYIGKHPQVTSFALSALSYFLGFQVLCGSQILASLSQVANLISALKISHNFRYLAAHRINNNCLQGPTSHKLKTTSSTKKDGKFLKIYEHRNHVSTTRVLGLSFSFSSIQPQLQTQPNPTQSSPIPRTNPSQLRGFRSCRYDAWLDGKRCRCRCSCQSSLRIHVHVLSVCEFKSVCRCRRIWIYPRAGAGTEEILWPCGSPFEYKTQGKSTADDKQKIHFHTNISFI